MKLTELARKTIESKLMGRDFQVSADVRKKYKRKAAAFVTLTKNGELRGCIGSLIGREQLYRDVMSNALNAAFKDPRFPPVQDYEMPKIKIEVSVLAIPRILKYKDEDDLLKKLNHKKGIILRKGNYSATFLPQVWEELPDKVNFLEHLSLKAGLNKDAWKTAEIKTYSVKVEVEK